MSTELLMPYNYLILCHPLLLLPSIFPSIRVFSESAVCIRWQKYWSFSFSISPSNEYSGLISSTAGDSIFKSLYTEITQVSDNQIYECFRNLRAQIKVNPEQFKATHRQEKYGLNMTPSCRRGESLETPWMRSVAHVPITGR